MNRSAALALAAALLAAASLFGWQRATPDLAGAPAASPPDATVLDGAVVFRTKGCASCHAAKGTMPPYQFGYPDLTDADAWAGGRRAGLSGEGYIRESVRDPNAVLSPAYRGTSPSPMPTLPLSDAEVDAVIAYLLRT